MREPIIKFSDWVEWKSRSSLDNINFHGVYLLAHFHEEPPKQLLTDNKKIIYVGETCNRTLRERWNQFNQSAFTGNKGHSGGRTYFKTFCGQNKKLYVSAFLVNDFKNDLHPYFIRYVERKLIWEYSKKWCTSPICNRK